MQTVGEKIASLRRGKSMTQEELAANLGVSAQSVSKWENSVTMPDILLLPVIAGIFDVTVDELFSIERPERISSFPVNETPSAVHRAVIDTMWAWCQDNDPDMTLKSLRSSPQRNTGFLSRQAGAVYANKDIALVWLPGEKESLPMLEDESISELLTVLADPYVRRIMKHLIENPVAYTVSSIAVRCGMDEENARNVFEKLESLSFVLKQTVDIGTGECLDVYNFSGGHKVKLLVYPILSLAGRLADFHEDWCGFRN